MVTEVETNIQHLNSPSSSNAATIRKTIIERNVRSVDNGEPYQNGTIAQRHIDDQSELQTLQEHRVFHDAAYRAQREELVS